MAPSRLPGGFIPRPALIERLRGGSSCVLTLLSAPAGFGKTTLLTEWVTSRGQGSTSWVSLDKGDTDPVRLWSHVIAALAESEPGVGAASLAAVRARPDDIAAYALPKLLEELPLEGSDHVLILDDFHLAESPVTNDAIEAFMRYRPARIQLVIATRSDPGLGVARLRAYGSLLEIRAEQLRFNDREIGDFLKALGLDSVSASEEVRLAKRTGGWPAPLRLFALLMADHDAGEFLGSSAVANRPVIDYLTSDVLELLEPHVHEFLLQASILTRMNAALCDAVVAVPGSATILADLELSNMFTSVDDTGEWYRLHDLFAGGLRLELGRTRAELVPVLHQRAARWLEETGDLELATAHAISARDLGAASRLVARQAWQFTAEGRSATVRGWLADLSWPAAQVDSELAFVRATLAVLTHDIDDAEHWLDVAATGPEDLIGSMGLPLGYRTDFLRAIVSVNDVPAARAAACRAVQSAPAPQWEGVALAGLGQAEYLLGQHDEAERMLRKAVGLISGDTPQLLAFAIGTLVLAEYARGADAHAAPMLDGALELLRTTGWERSPLSAVVHMACGERARSSGDAREAARWFGTAIEMLGSCARSGWLANAYLLQARTCQKLGDAQQQTRYLDAADAILTRLPNAGALTAVAERLRRDSSVVARHVTRFGEQLSDREVAVLKLAADGLTQRQIADQLFISYNTVKTHFKTTYRKLGATSRLEALAQLDDCRQIIRQP
jgi:LuxR family maltose regulon positive regulatory protein